MTYHALMATAQRRGEAVNEELGFDFSHLNDNQLDAEIQVRTCGVGTSVKRTAEEINSLLPALLEMQKRLPHGRWESYLKTIGLKPATVRKWKCRIPVRLLETVGGHPRRVPKLKLKESAAVELAHFGKKLSDAVRKKNWERAEELADEYHEMYAPATPEFYGDPAEDWEHTSR